jgi:hypothetical protein
MKAISLYPEYCDAVFDGKKTEEYRAWPTKYRGDILICRTVDPDNNYPGLCGTLAELYDCVRRNDGGYAFLLRNIRHIKPFVVKGRQRIYNIDIEPSDLVVLETQEQEDAAWDEFSITELGWSADDAVASYVS